MSLLFAYLFLLNVLCYGQGVGAWQSVCSISLSPLQGFYPPVFTPMDNYGRLKLDVIPTYARFLKKRGISKVLLTGTTGEGPTLTLSERMDVLDAWMTQAKYLDLNVIMQVGAMALPDVLKLASYSASADVDAVLTLPELYYKPSTVAELVEYVAQVARECHPVPIMYYDLPAVTGVSLSMAEFFKEAAQKIPNFAGLKTPLESALTVIARNVLNDNQTVLVATENIAPVFEQCLNGTVSGAASIFPDLVVAVREAVMNSDVVRAKNLQLEVSRRMAAITFTEAMSDTGENIALMKAGMEIVTGIPVGPTRDPLPKVTPQQRRQIANNLQNMGVHIAPIPKYSYGYFHRT